jgi:hypothetical protein
MQVPRTICHAFNLQPIGIFEVHCVIVLVILTGGIDDLYPSLPQKGLEVIDVLPIPQLQRIVMQSRDPRTEMARANR